MVNQVVQGEFKKSKSTVMRKVASFRKINNNLRGKRHLSHSDMEVICKSIREGSRYKHRDECMVRMAFNHGLRVSELLNLRWQHISFKPHEVSIKRLKNSISGVHPILDKKEIRLLTGRYKEQGKPTDGYVFNNERGNAVSVDGMRNMFSKYSINALGIPWNLHALRHGCATHLISKGNDIRMVQNWMGHSNIQNTTIYLHESSNQFAGLNV